MHLPRVDVSGAGENTCRGDVNGSVDVFLEKDCGQSWEEWHGQGQRKETGRPCKYWCLYKYRHEWMVWFVDSMNGRWDMYIKKYVCV